MFKFIQNKASKITLKFGDLITSSIGLRSGDLVHTQNTNVRIVLRIIILVKSKPKIDRSEFLKGARIKLINEVDNNHLMVENSVLFLKFYIIKKNSIILECSLRPIASYKKHYLFKLQKFPDQPGNLQNSLIFLTSSAFTDAIAINLFIFNFTPITIIDIFII
ncbi:hypothetical protein BpHYR1_049776 [Brachionus plicatilis]|uniref:Uncharacterized protein n=1 Tax=Brachionus plicatilis TaxID=10195 RepID=A0A3M7PGS0_BRAPC|nr:hypothetical protein BpHYR1_049776 [Brachionus plicatilis]